MIKKIAWETFKNTGDINAFMELRQIEKIEEGIEVKDGKYENKWNSIIRK